MKLHRPLPLAALLFVVLSGFAHVSRAAACPPYLNHDFQKLHSSEHVNICKAFAGKPLLIVNTASHCGYTPQFSGLEAVNERYRARGLVVIGFPSDDFNQEAKDEAETAQVCFVNFGVTFTMLSPLHVKGSAANPVFRELARQSHEPTWNFNKYLVEPDGAVLRYFDSDVTPDSDDFETAVEQLLGPPVGSHGG
jgi:glutathione peroxidase